jgi:hypothetical protein
MTHRTRPFRVSVALRITTMAVLSLCVTVDVRAAETADTGEAEMIRRIESLYQKAADARAKDDHQAARTHLKEALKQGPFTGKFRDLPSFLHFELAQVEAGAGNAEAAMQELESSAAAGLAETGDLESSSVLSTLKGHARMAAVLERVRKNATTARVFDVSLQHNAELGHASLHVFEARDSAMMGELAANKDLHRHMQKWAKSEADEWQRQLALMAWVHDRWAHAGINEPSRADAATILREVEAGKRFRCVEYSLVLAAVMQLFGHPARVVSLRRDGSSYGIGKGHVVTEVWSNTHQKWIVMDGQNNATWQSGKTPLSAAEVRRARRDDVGSLRFVRGPSSWQQKSSDAQMFKEWVVYFDHLTYTLDNTQPAGPDRARLWLLQEDERPELLFQGSPTTGQQWTRDTERVYARMNGVHIDAWPADDAALGTLTLMLTHAMPWFEKIDLVHNGKRVDAAPALAERQATRASTSKTATGSDVSSGASSLFARVALIPGKNTIVVHAVNAQGVRGPPSSIEIDFYPPPAVSPAPAPAARAASSRAETGAASSASTTKPSPPSVRR